MSPKLRAELYLTDIDRNRPKKRILLPGVLAREGGAGKKDAFLWPSVCGSHNQYLSGLWFPVMEGYFIIPERNDNLLFLPVLAGA